jgi:hypothetical protein
VSASTFVVAWVCDGEDLREWLLVERKRRLRRRIPSVPTRLLYVDHVQARGRTSSRSRVRTTSRESWASSRAVAAMRTARAPTGARSRLARTCSTYDEGCRLYESGAREPASRPRSAVGLKPRGGHALPRVREHGLRIPCDCSHPE